MKRYLAAAGVGTLVFGAVIGSASALDITDPGVAQYGEAFDLTCDTDGVNVEGYFPDTEAGAESVSNGVVISGISEECAGKTLVVGLTHENGDALARGFKVIGDSGTETVKYNLNGPAQVPFSQIGGIRLTIG